MVERKTKIMQLLKEHNYFQECILEEVLFNNYGTTISLSFDYIWANNFDLRSDLDSKQIIKLIFSSVNRFVVLNELSDAVINEPEMINWGFNEISKINLVESTTCKFIQVEIIWETKRKIIIEFLDMVLEQM